MTEDQSKDEYIKELHRQLACLDEFSDNQNREWMDKYYAMHTKARNAESTMLKYRKLYLDLLREHNRNKVDVTESTENV